MNRQFERVPARTCLLAIMIFAPILAGGVENPSMLEKFDFRDASAQQLIRYKDGVLIKSDDFRTYHVMFAKFSSEETVPVAVEGMEHLFDTGQSPNGFLFLGIKNKQMVLVEESKSGERQLLAVPKEWHPKSDEDLRPGIRAHLVPGSHRCVAIANDTIWVLDDSWKSYKLPAVPKFYKEFSPIRFGAVQSLEGDRLYAGWNEGEWGGMLASIHLNATKLEWIHLSGKIRGDDSGILRNDSVEAMISTDDSGLWVASSSAYGLSMGLHRRKSNGEWQSLIDGDFGKDWGIMKLPQPYTINDLAVDARGRVYILAGGRGVFMIEKDRLSTILSYDFDISSKLDDYIIGCSPDSIAVGTDGEIFISTNSFGILAFKKTRDEWVGKQIMIKLNP